MPQPLSNEVPSSTIQEFDAIEAYLKAVNEILHEGHMPDMSSLEGKVAHLCSSVQKAGPETKGQYVAKLGELMKKLQACEERVISFHAALTQSEKK